MVDSNRGCEKWLNSGKLVGWLCLSPATSLVLQSAAILVSRPDQVNYLGDTTGEYGLHHVIEQNTTFASIHLCETVGKLFALVFFFLFCFLALFFLVCLFLFLHCVVVVLCELVIVPSCRGFFFFL